jgi:hypothetical protein
MAQFWDQYDHYKVASDGMTFQVVNERDNTIVCSTHWRCNADKVCAALNSYAGPRKPTVEDMDRRCVELLNGGDGERTFGSIREQLISEFGEELFEKARKRVKAT